MSSTTRIGLLLAVAAHALWGVFPIYWNLLAEISSAELVCHRILWAFVFALLIAAFRYSTRDQEYRRSTARAFSKPQTWRTYALAGVLIAINWLSFLWAVNNDRVLLSSLGYYINPLFNVMLGVLVLGERLRTAGWVAIAVAAVGVSVMTYGVGEIPWVSFAMASSFACYALVKKKAKLDPLNGLLVETSVLIVPTLIYLFWIASTESPGRDWDATTSVLLVLGGLVTITPLALFAGATQRAPLSLIGILQYIGPTLQFLVGVFYFGEPMTSSTLIGFAFVWTGVAIFLWSTRKS